MHLDPDWVAAIGQVAGAVATFLAVVVALRIAARDRRQREQDRLDEAVGNIAVSNHGDRPVRDVRVSVGVPPGSRVRWTPNNGTGKVTGLLPANRVEKIRSNYVQVFGGHGSEPDAIHPLDRAPAESWIVLEFFDVEGRQWVRAGNERPIWQRDAPAKPNRDAPQRRLYALRRWRYRAARGDDNG